MKKYICPACGKRCDIKRCDDGIGSYEFWGQKCKQSNPYMGSDCCEEFLDEVTYCDPDDLRADAVNDRIKDDFYESQERSYYGAD